MDILYLYNKISTYLNSPEFLSVFFNNRFYMILLVVFLMRLKYASYRSFFVSALVNVPGTFLHEFMHLAVGAALNAQPVNFTIIPKRNSEGGYTMGSVSFRNITFYNAIPASLAPLLLLPLSFYLNRYWLPIIDPDMINYIIYIFLQTIIIENAIPSRTDFKVAGLYFSGVLMYTLLIILLLFII